MAANYSRSSILHDLTKNNLADKKRQLLMNKGMTKEDLEIRKFRVAVLNRSLGAIGIPIFLWLLLETFFK